MALNVHSETNIHLSQLSVANDFVLELSGLYTQNKCQASNQYINELALYSTLQRVLIPEPTAWLRMDRLKHISVCSSDFYAE